MIDQREIHKQCLSADSEERIEALRYIRNNYSLMPDIQQVWNDLIKLTSDQDSEVSYASASFLGAAVSQVPDKQQAWDDLIRLTTRKEKDIRYEAASSLGSAFPKVPNKQQAWNDLIKLTSNQDSDVRYTAASLLGFAFLEVPDKQYAWDDLHRLVKDTDVNVRRGVASSLGFAFSNVPDKQQAWDDLHRLVKDTDVNVRRGVASSLGFAFSNVPDKQQAWDDLHRLTLDQDVYVRQRTARFLGSAYPHVPKKHQVWNDLIKMASDESNDIKALANHSLGKVSIFEASQAENEESYKKELEESISFFEKAAQQSTYKWLNPSQFCLPFYRSFNNILFKKQEAKGEVDKYLVEAKNAVKGSKNKEFLFEAIENLSCALKEVQNLDLDFEAKKGELNSYRIYCDRAAEAIRNTEEAAPYAAATMRKGLPILDRNLKTLIKEIQEKAKRACKESIGTDKEKVACAVNREVQKWEIGSQEYLKMQIENLIDLLKFYIPTTKENTSIINKTNLILQESDIVKQYMLLNNLIPQIIEIQASKKTELALNEIQELRHSVDRLVASTDELQNPQEYLDTMQQNLEKIKNDIPEMKEKIDEVLYELYSPMSTTQKLKVAIPIIPSLVSYEMETDVPKLVAEKIHELKNLLLSKNKKMLF